MIISHLSPEYRTIFNGTPKTGRHNGAYYYSKEILRNIIPNVDTDYNWVTINCGVAVEHSIVFIHNNIDPSVYDYLTEFKDLILVVGVEETADKVKWVSDKVIYLPLSVDVEEVEKFKRDNKPYQLAFFGRPSKRWYESVKFSENCDFHCGLERPQMLAKMAKYKKVYAVGRCAIEAKVLGCEVLPYDSRYPDPSVWKVLDNKDAAKILQKELDKLKGRHAKSKS